MTAIASTGSRRCILATSLAIAAALATWLVVHVLGHGEVHHAAHLPPLWGLGLVPFGALLGFIAFLPLIPATAQWWHSNLNRFFVAMLCAGATLIYVAIAMGPSAIGAMLDHAILVDYIPFIILLFALYVISGGIHLEGDLVASPRVNTIILGLGAVIASFVGTTGASMLLIRPLLKTNSDRKHVVHTVVFFIFLVSNIGGTLLPIGDPPLYLGYLRQVPFFWTLDLWPAWAATCSILLVVYFIFDSMAWNSERGKDLYADLSHFRPMRVRGSINVLWIGGIVAAAALIDPSKPLPGIDWMPFPYLRECIMLALVALSLATTRREHRYANNFNYSAIIEVAAIFAGIFVAMQVPLELLRASGETITATVNQPWHFFWATGSLSSFLDNAPTYVVFFDLAASAPTDAATLAVSEGRQIPEHLLVAISLGAVFMGSMTYIGNGPNFMVKAIAEQEGIAMPSFLGFMFRYSIPILVPIFVIVTLIFLT